MRCWNRNTPFAKIAATSPQRFSLAKPVSVFVSPIMTAPFLCARGSSPGTPRHTEPLSFRNLKALGRSFRRFLIRAGIQSANAAMVAQDPARQNGCDGMSPLLGCHVRNCSLDWHGHNLAGCGCGLCMPKSREVAGNFSDIDYVATSTGCGHIRLHGWWGEQRFWGGRPVFPRRSQNHSTGPPRLMTQSVFFWGISWVM